MKDPGRTPRVAKILERHELRAQLVGACPVLANACLEQAAAGARGDAARTGGESLQPEVPHVNDRRTLAHAAYDALTIDPSQQSVEVWIVPRVLEHHRIFDCDRNAVIYQASDGIEPGFFI